ncbi:MAG: dual specificity protein phosphatase [Thermoanaerobaculia bacterium]
MPDTPESRHRIVYATPNLPLFQTWPAAPRIFAGRNPLTEIDVRELASRGITHVLDLREPGEWNRPGIFGSEAVEAMEPNGISRKNVPIVDISAPTAEALTAAGDWIDQVLADPASKLFVHCRAGIERTGSILAAWRCRREGESFDVALDALRGHGWPANPLAHQRDAVHDWLTKQ